MALTFEQLIEIDELIDSKGWSEKKNKKGESIKDIAFDLFGLTNTEEEFYLIKHLLSKYFLCTEFSDYCNQMAKNMEAVFKGQNVVIIPVSDEKQKIKSGHYIAYELTCYLDKTNFTEFHSLESLESLKGRLSDFSILVVDDFIGSGSQFRAFARTCSEKYGVTKDNIYLYSIVMMKRAHSRIKDYCYGAFSCIEFQRALSDDIEINNRMLANTVYANIERTVDIGKNYRRGFLKSEALVTMKKTPNNTLPIFWGDMHTNGDKWPAMFPRPK
ncbi:phosphoribosyltransferase-like protein [Brucella anthropi]|uniref:phosphoribosyltransferase-like protein n=1 Tax=Brucella anthropi TaxID=529 RepID=UPI00077505B4|nr:hypothetical protein [Brucella anthropi]KXO77727.1 hypothetical protein AYJ56_19725 [Brucella anthropi]